MYFSVVFTLLLFPCIVMASRIYFQFPDTAKHVTKVELYGSDVSAQLLEHESYAGSYTIKEGHFNYIEVPDGTVDTLEKNTYVCFKFMKDDGFYKTSTTTDFSKYSRGSYVFNVENVGHVV